MFSAIYNFMIVCRYWNLRCMYTGCKQCSRKQH